MTAKKNPQPEPNEMVSNYSAIPSTNEIDETGPVLVETEVQIHKKKKQSSLIDRAKKKMQETLNSDDDDETPQSKKSKSAPGYIRPQQREELSTLVASVFVMLITASDIPDEIAPDTDEINGVSEHLIKILARHVDLSKRLTGDVLDIIGIIAICSGWYTRVAPYISQMRKDADARKKGLKRGTNAIPVYAPVQDEVEAQEAVSNFLNVAALSGGEGAIQE